MRMGHSIVRALLPAAIVALPPAAALADSTTGVITGTVIDVQSKRPLPDVVIDMAGPNGEQVVLTDSSGSFRIPGLAPGSYTIRVNNEGYKPSGSSVTVSANQTIRANITLSPLALQAQEVTISAKAPTVDIGSAQTGTVLTRELMSRVALSRPTSKGGAARSFESVAEVAPGARNDDYGASINGATSPENQYVVDGVSVNNPAYGLVGTPLSVDFVKEVSVVTGGYMPEYGRATGGVLNVVTKSGTNELHGSAFTSISPGALEGERARVRAAGQTISTDRALDSIHDMGADLGGPIIKDRLWFYGGLGYNNSRYRVEQAYNRRKIGASPLLDNTGVPHPEIGYDWERDANGDPVTERIPGTTSARPATQRGLQYIGKLSFAVTPDHRLDLSVFGAPAESGGNGAYGLEPASGATEGAPAEYTAAAHRYVNEANDIALKYSGAFDNKSLLIEASLGWHHQRSAVLPSDGAAVGSGAGLSGVPMIQWQRQLPFAHDITEFARLPAGQTCAPGIAAPVDNDPTTDADGDGDPTNDFTAFVLRDPQCPLNVYFTGGPDYIDDSQIDRYQASAAVTKLFQGLGHHIVKAGVSFEQMSYTHKKAYSGNARFWEIGDGSLFVVPRGYGFLSSPDAPVFNDSQTASSSSSSFGVFVQDSFSLLDRVTLNLGVRYDNQYMFGGDGRLGLGLPFMLSPRVGAIYDVTRQGRSKIYVNYARYYESIPLSIADRSLPSEAQVASLRRSPAALDAAFNPDGSPINNCDPRDPAQSAGICRQPASLLPIGRLSRASYAPSQYYLSSNPGDLPVDPALEPASTDEIILGGEYEIIQDGRIGVQYTHRSVATWIEDMSRDEGSTFFIGNPGRGIAKDFIAAQRDYDAVLLFFTKTFADRWLAQASYTLSFLRGNISGLYVPETGQLTPNGTTDFDLQSLVVNRYGPLPGDRTHEIKVYLARDFPFDEFFAGPRYMQLNVGLGYAGRSGGPTSFLAAHQQYGNSQVHILPRGSGERLPYVHSLDGHLQYDVLLGDASAVSVYMDVFNVFNFQEATAVDEDYTLSAVKPIIDGKPTVGKDGELEPDQAELVHPDGSPFNAAVEKNPNFGNPVRYQPPRSFRFGAKVTF